MADTPKIRILIVFAVALLYALLARLLFTWEPLRAHLSVVSWAFISLVPLAFGALTTFLGYRFCGRSRFWVYGAPAIVIALGLVGSIITRLEAVLCVVVALPIMLPFALLGGILMGWILKKSSGNLPVAMLVLLPFTLAPIEAHWHQPAEEVSIQDSILIAASVEDVWDQIASVPTIQPGELPFQLIYLLDFPRPVSAEIDFHGLGAKRRAIFERDVSFFEVITDWQPWKTLAFSIEADPAFIPHTAFDQHIIVGGRFYDVLDGRYDIEPTSSGSRLILTSTHRLSTPFNSYAGFWSKWVMNQIQGSILKVIRSRTEQSAERRSVAGISQLRTHSKREDNRAL